MLMIVPQALVRMELLVLMAFTHIPATVLPDIQEVIAK